jgi:ribulose-phosphate 3-epimerase
MTGTATRPGSSLERLRRGGPRLSVGMLTADLLELGRELERLAATGTELVHIDVMDGVYCPQLTFGPPLVKAIRTPMLKDVHLMVADPLSKVEAFVAAGADIVTFHLAGVPHPHRVLRVLGAAGNVNDPARGIVRGVGLDPSTPVEAIEPLLDELELVLVLAIDPGWSGQSFLPATAERLARVQELVAAARRPILVELDGGVTRANIEQVGSLGADIVVTGSAVFDGGDVAANVALMQAGVIAGAARTVTDPA